MNRLDDTDVPDGPEGPDDAVWEDAVRGELERRVRDLHEAPLTLPGVRAAARAVQRRRRVATAGAVLAAAAVITPAALIAVSGPGGDDTPDVATDVPIAAYVEGRTLVRSDGSELDLPRSYSSVTTLGDRLLATRFDREGTQGTVDVLDDDGALLDSFGVRAAPVANAAHTAVTWLSDDGTLLARSEDAADDGSDDVDLGGPLPEDAQVDALTGSPECGRGDDGCFVYLVGTAADGTVDASVVLSDSGPSSGPERAVPDAVRYQDATDERVAVVAELADLASCGGVYDLRAQEYLFRTCERQAEDLSPDGSLVAGGPDYYDGTGPSDLTVLDATTGATVAEVAPPGDDGYVVDWTWRADGSLLVQAHEDGAFRLLRVPDDGGEPTLVAGPVEAPFERPPFVLVQGP